MDIKQIGLVGSNNASSGSNTKTWCNNDSEVQRGERGSGPLIKHHFTTFQLQRQKEYCFKHICIICVYLNNTSYNNHISFLCDHIYTYTCSKLSNSIIKYFAEILILQLYQCPQYMYIHLYIYIYIYIYI